MLNVGIINHGVQGSRVRLDNYCLYIYLSICFTFYSYIYIIYAICLLFSYSNETKKANEKLEHYKTFQV